MCVLHVRKVSALHNEDIAYWNMRTNPSYRFKVVDRINEFLNTTAHRLIVFEHEGLMKSYDVKSGVYGTFLTQFFSLESM